MAQVTGPITRYPARASVAWYLAVIVLGTFVLRLPACGSAARDRISWLDAVFTSTSATCVTGLAVRSTSEDFSLLGQAVLLILIQIGGIGIMTVTTYITFGWSRRQGLRERALLAGTLGAGDEADLRWVLRNVLGLTFVFESIGFIILAAHNLTEQPPLEALWHALFHSVSAFCNAGFALYDDSLTRWQADPVVNLTICALIICGGIGFPATLDIKRNLRSPYNEFWHRLHLHSKLMLIGTTALIFIGMFGVLILEWDEMLAGRPLGERLLVSFFQSVTTRTAGFNTVEISSLTNATLFLMILLMMIGAGPCSTGGGFKVSTLMTLMLRAWSTLNGVSRINAFHRTIPEETVDRSIVTALMFAVVSVIGLTGLLVIEQSGIPHYQSKGIFLDALFEIVSALGTVGLSTGTTPHLTAAGRWIIIVMMFLGRLGPISVAGVLTLPQRNEPLEMPSEEPLIG